MAGWLGLCGSGWIERCLSIGSCWPEAQGTLTGIVNVSAHVELSLIFLSCHCFSLQCTVLFLIFFFHLF